MRSVVVQELPPFDTGSVEGVAFSINHGNAVLELRVTDLYRISLEFEKVRWHEYTALYNCSPEQTQAYFRLLEIEGSEWAAKYMRADRAPIRAYPELHHYRIFIDEHGCHEVLAASWRAL